MSNEHFTPTTKLHSIQLNLTVALSHDDIVGVNLP